mmetsp:Transcript_12240/g.24409  ORF Transcript_12240/g.24409 Transcript_12240/m.24409 type:complete len:94 (-) Transcript_12240:96-377(-)|eukprot:CAMPEP_0181343028 /NCGR_PEP_ID=MMETSP1101-20121128/31355_1 /TAXON_ID=46948 /ORGANISM="Rhodomonas abbreviata, Strain Caron Lab Isolate" /LENGTH=93 /DNA_ID=CAMNT_0023454605 /DNA_START=33 /DNA_END=314 /DNA_ORIENTATION=+
MSVTTTKKNEQFQGTPLQDCKLADVPGVGGVSMAKLAEANITTAEHLIGQFLSLSRDSDKMTNWLEEVCEIRNQEAKKVSEALAEKAAKLVLH